jgi:hypothetical protein
MAATPSLPIFDSSFFNRFEFQRADGCQAEKKEEG